MRIDSHQHFWTLKRDDYGWLTPEQAVLYRDFLPADLSPLLKQAGIDCTVLVQAAPTVEETRYLLGLAERHELVAAVVGWVDMQDHSASVQDLQELTLNPYFRGVRPMIQDIPDPGWMLRPSLREAFQFIVDHDLCFDALVKPMHLPHLLALMDRHPDLKVVVDHCAKPDIGGGEWLSWADRIGQIAVESAAYCKVSGLITETNATPSYLDLRPYMEHVLECFGPKRVMWGSDWPVLNARDHYCGWHSATQGWLSTLNARDREAIEGGTAARFYSIASSG